MKKLLALALTITAVFAFAPTKAEAGNRCRVIGHCNHCHSPVYSYYRHYRAPCGGIRYTWVPSYHSNCHSGSVRYSHSHSYSRPYYRPATRPTSRFHGNFHGNSCRTPSVTFRFGRSAFHFR